MKKTLTVNLGGMVFQIDEDAYILIDNYLINLRFHFCKEQEGEEIVRDMEIRIGELFAESLEGGQQVITIDIVESVINRMGRPEQLDIENDEKDSFSTDSVETESQSSEIKKRLFRDVDHSVLGGVLAGIAAYFGWDATALRIVYIVLGLLPGGPSVLLIYFILLFIIPPARTATEKLQMRGEPVNMENIGKTVTDGFERDGKTQTNKQRTGFQKFLDLVIGIVGVLVQVLVGVIIICCIPFLLVGFIAFFSLIMSFFGIIINIPTICWDLMPSIPWNSIITSPFIGTVFVFSILLVMGIPVMVILQMVMQHLGYCKPMTMLAKLTMILVWLIALVASYLLLFSISGL